MNEVTNRWNNFSVKDTSQYPDIWFNELFNLNLKFKRIQSNYEKDEDELKAQFIEVVPEDYKTVILS